MVDMLGRKVQSMRQTCSLGLQEEGVTVVPEEHASFSQLVDSLNLPTQAVEEEAILQYYKLILCYSAQYCWSDEQCTTGLDNPNPHISYGDRSVPQGNIFIKWFSLRDPQSTKLLTEARKEWPDSEDRLNSAQFLQ